MVIDCPPGYASVLEYIGKLRDNIVLMRRIDADQYAEAIQREEDIIRQYESEQVELRE